MNKCGLLVHGRKDRKIMATIGNTDTVGVSRRRMKVIRRQRLRRKAKRDLLLDVVEDDDKE